MTIKLQIYKCEICGNLVLILNEGEGNLVCCGQEMELQTIKYDTTELGEKHTPKISTKDGKKCVNVIGHPMTNEHYIQFIETISENRKEVYLKFFSPEEIPEADISFMPKESYSLEYCNIHGLWGENRMLTNESGDYSI